LIYRPVECLLYQPRLVVVVVVVVVVVMRGRVKELGE
jgi:hypothetical protein